MAIALLARRETLKTKEQFLRKEIRANRTVLLGLLKWGLAVLAGIASSLYYIRRDVAQRLSALGALPAHGTVPAGRWFVGTVFLAMIAFIFCCLAKHIIRRHVAYRNQLLEMKGGFSGIEEGPTGGRINGYHYYLFYAFPAFDLVLWFYFRATGTISIPW